MKNISPLKSLITIFVFWILAASCSPSAANFPPTVSVTQTPAATNTIVVPTIVAENSPSPVVVPTPKRIVDLLRDKDECSLPCWWGITPGTTPAPEAEAILKSFGAFIAWQDFNERGGVVSLEPSAEGFQVHLEYIRADDIVQILHVTVNMIKDEGEGPIMVYGEPLYKDVMQEHLISQTLSEFGKPSAVLFKTYQQSPNWFPAHTLLYYPEHGVLVEYISPNRQGNNAIETCPQNGNISFWLVSSGQEITLENLYFGDNIHTFLPLEEATNKSVEGFYSIFKDPENETCLITPESIWPLYPGG